VRTTDGADYWDGLAERYAAGRAPSAVDRATLAAAPPRGAVLELGAGPGVFTRQALAHPARRETMSPETLRLPTTTYVATDVSPRFCEMLRALPVTVICADHRAVALPDGGFDAIYAMATLHHLSPGDCAAALALIAGWLSPGGRFALVEDWAFEPADEAQRRLVRLRAALRDATDPGERHPSEAEWTARLEGVGLEVVEVQRAPRPESLRRYGALTDPGRQADLAWLHEHAPAPEIPMSILIARRAR